MKSTSKEFSWVGGLNQKNFNPDYALDFIRKEIRQNSSEARKFSSADAALAA